jgi:hypothetical protein
MAIVENKSNEQGDILRISTGVPIIGVITLYSFFDETEGETGSKYFDKQFRYSVDGGMNFTEWYDLTTINIQNVDVSRKDLFVLEYKYTNVGAGTDELTWNATVLDGNVVPPAYPFYDKSIFPDFFPVNDPAVLGWAINVLEKLYMEGILPRFILRGTDEINPYESDRDFLHFFNSVTHFFAIIVYYARQYRNIKYNPILSRELILSRGLIPYKGTDPEITKYLFENYQKEFEKRGTSAIAQKGTFNEVEGELLRLIDYSLTDEFIFALIEDKYLGWCLGFSSPTWTSTKGATNVVKAYEPTKDVVNLALYPKIQPTYLSIDTDSDLSVLKISGHQSTGLTKIGIGTDTNFKVIVSPTIDYEISFKIKKLTAAPISLNFGVLALDIDGLPTTVVNFGSGSNTNYFVENTDLNTDGVYYSFRGVVFNKDKTLNPLNVPMLEGGNHLRMGSDVRYLIPEITVSGVGAVSDVLIYDIKLQPCNFNFSQGQLGVKNVIWGLMKNNSGYTEEEVSNFISTYLIPYKNKLKTQYV